MSMQRVDSSDKHADGFCPQDSGMLMVPIDDIILPCKGGAEACTLTLLAGGNGGGLEGGGGRPAVLRKTNVKYNRLFHKLMAQDLAIKKQ